VAIRIAFFSPLPPARSGIADYSAALFDELRRLADVHPFTAKPAAFDPSEFDVVLYQIGNNSFHDFCYETALEHPGVVVMHEANLHHLVADLTIKRGDWDAYLREVEFEAGEKALEYARRVKRLEVGPDYEGVPMLRRLLGRSKAAIVHSGWVESELRQAGFAGPIARIHHGAWIPEADRMGYRQRLGIDETTPLIGIFGFLKPYKRIAESLRAFARLVRLEPKAKMILVGEPHPELHLDSLIDTLGLRANVRVLGFTPIDDFVGYVAASDIVLNLRFPTVGENSGTLMRALGLGKAVVVSEIGSFCELPGDICLKTPVDATEEDHLFEYLNLLVSRPDIRRALGDRARAWVERECAWPRVAARYAAFLESVVTGAEFEPSAVVADKGLVPAGLPSPNHDGDATAEARAVAAESECVEAASFVEPEYILGWAPNKDARAYIETHLTRLTKTMEITPRGCPNDRILEMGSYLQITPALRTKLGYGEVRGCYYGPAGKVDHKKVVSIDGEEFICDLDLFNAEKDRFPYGDEYFTTVLCCELLEHLFEDPMHMMSEINRILKPDGRLVLTTPNIGSLRAISAILQGYHPGFFPAYVLSSDEGKPADARHNREYSPKEIQLLLLNSGFEVELLETGEFLDAPKPEHEWVLHLLERYEFSKELRGDGIYAVARKAGPVRDRYPSWLYN
jgi:glycosyltransferase involved in cell wall biosynthesis/SAM-dependent methyltransferase